jgi:outer membrane immunogenic protein
MAMVRNPFQRLGQPCLVIPRRKSAFGRGKFSYWLPSNWTWKLEYLYLDLGSLNTTNPFPPALPLSSDSTFTGTFTTHTHFTDNIVRVGLNYQFH